MEIEFNPKNLKDIFYDNIGGILLLLLVILCALGFLGRTFTPQSNALLNWNEWQILKVENEYKQELSILQRQIESLSMLLDAQPDPVRGQIISDQIINRSSRGLSALELQRAALAAAARAVRQWAIGADTRANAQIELQNAISQVAEAEKALTTQENGGGEKWR